MTWVLVLGAVWVLASVAAALGIARAIAIADRKAAARRNGDLPHVDDRPPQPRPTRGRTGRNRRNAIRSRSEDY